MEYGVRVIKTSGRLICNVFLVMATLRGSSSVLVSLGWPLIVSTGALFQSVAPEGIPAQVTLRVTDILLNAINL